MERMQPTYRIQESAMAIPAGLDHEQLSYLIHDMRSVTTSVALMVDLLELAAKAEDDTIQRAAQSLHKRAASSWVYCALKLRCFSLDRQTL